MKKKVLFVSLVFLLTGCLGSHIKNMKLSPEQNAYWTRAQATPLNFSVKKEKSNQVWSRGMDFISRFAPTVIQNSSDYVVNTHNIPDQTNLVYRINRVDQGDKVTFRVKCRAMDGAPLNEERKNAKNNAHLLAYYMKSGKLMPNLVAKSSM